MRANQVCAVLLAALLGMAASADAKGGGTHVKAGGMGMLVPATSPVRVASADREQTFVKFAGRFTINGTYGIECDDFVADPCALDSLEVFIEPDAKLLASLPRWDTYKTNKPMIEITDAAGFIKANLDATTLVAFKNGSLTQKTGYASIVVDNLVTGVDCDSPWYSAHLVSFAPVTRIAAREPDGNRGCA